MENKQYIWWMTDEELVHNFRSGLINRIVPAFANLPDYIKNLLCWIHEVGYRAHATAFLFNKQNNDVEQAQLGTINKAEFQNRIGLILNESDLKVVKTVIQHATWGGGMLSDFQLKPIP